MGEVAIIIDPSSTTQVTGWVLASLLVIGTAGMLSVNANDRVCLPGDQYVLPDTCYFRLAWQIDCPGCGLTRSFVHAAHLRMRDAWHKNPVGLLLFNSIAISIPWRIIQWHKMRAGRPLPSSTRFECAWIALLAALMILTWAFKLVESV